ATLGDLPLLGGGGASGFASHPRYQLKCNNPAASGARWSKWLCPASQKNFAVAVGLPDLRASLGQKQEVNMENPKNIARDEWRAGRKALVDELTRLREQFNSGGWAERPAFSLTAPAR